MASGGLLAVLDDISVIMDDVAAMSKIAARKTAGIVGDDLAVNANVVVGLDPSRELPIVGKIALGSLANKAVLIPLALILPSSVIGPVLMLGGAFLCYEALHKVTHRNDPKQEQERQEKLRAAEQSPEALLEMEKQKVRGAIGTDAILSAEVIAVALGAVATAPFATKAITLTIVGLAMTVGVYGLVAAIVKVDDLGLHLQNSQGDQTLARFRRALGRMLVAAMPGFMKALSVLGTLAMFTVGGGILLHGIPGAETWLETTIASFASQALLVGVLDLAALLLFGIVCGAVAWPIFAGLTKAVSLLRNRKLETTPSSQPLSTVTPGQPTAQGQR